MENRRSKDDKMFRRIWEVVETKVGKTGMRKTKRRREERERGKKERNKRRKNRKKRKGQKETYFRCFICFQVIEKILIDHFYHMLLNLL